MGKNEITQESSSWLPVYEGEIAFDNTKKQNIFLVQRAIEKYRNGEITKEEYDQWRYNYPKYDTYSRRAKVPSQEISDLFTK